MAVRGADSLATVFLQPARWSRPWRACWQHVERRRRTRAMQLGFVCYHVVDGPLDGRLHNLLWGLRWDARSQVQLERLAVGEPPGNTRTWPAPISHVLHELLDSPRVQGESHVPKQVASLVGTYRALTSAVLREELLEHCHSALSWNAQ